jgi:hypothetical protein
MARRVISLRRHEIIVVNHVLGAVAIVGAVDLMIG